MQKLPIIANVEGLGKIVEAISDFYTDLNQLKENRAQLISPRDEAFVRLNTRGKENIGKSYGTWTSVGFEYTKGHKPILNLKSRLLNYELAKQAVEANRNNRYFSTSNIQFYENSLKQAEKDKTKDPKDRSVIVLPSKDQFTISDKHNWDIYEMVLKDQAKPYFELNGPITIYPVDTKTIDSQNGTLLTQFWFRYLDGSSSFDGYWLIYDDFRARGVKKSGEATSQKIERILPYTQKEVDKSLRVVERIKQGKIRLSDLESEVEKIAKFLKSLKQ